MAMTREICGCCGAINAVGFHVPGEDWLASVPHKWRAGVLCLNCFTRFADEAKVEWDRYIEFFPVSWASHMREPCE